MPSRKTLSFVAVLLVTLWGAASASAEVGPRVLPDNRAWEQVSPVDKNGNDVGFGSPMAALDGNRLLYSSQGPFAGAQSALGVDGIRYMATRTADGWGTVSLMPPGGTLTLGFNGYQGFTEDLSVGVIKWMEDEITGTVDPQAQFGANLYMRDTATGSFRLLNGTRSAIPVDGNNGFVWGSSDFSKLAIESYEPLTADSPCVTGGDKLCAYEWDEGALRLASVLPSGEPTSGKVGNALWEGSTQHAMSADGRRLFFNSSGELYVREDGLTLTTELISSSERTLPGGASGDEARYQNAEAAHGDRVLFSTRNSLLDADTDATNDLYLYDFTRPGGERLTLVSEDRNPEVPGGAEVDGGFAGGFPLRGGVPGAAEDLRRVYFVADNQILPGEPTAPGPKLYLWDDTGASPELTYVATLADKGGPGGDGDLYDWSEPAVGKEFVKPARVSRDGRYLAFPSWAKLSEAAVEGRQEIYRYDAVAHSLECASCSADQFPAEPPKSGDGGDLRFADLFYGTKPNHVPRNVTDDGRVFFQTSRGLVPRDSNGKFDVYEYVDGTLHLISLGTGAHDSLFLDATPSGSDIFFITADRLVGWDRDNSYDAYDARVGGGLPEPPPPAPPCEGDACQPPPLLRTRASLGSASFEGPANSHARKRRPRCRQRKGSKKTSARTKKADTSARARHRRKCGAKQSHAKGKGR